MKDKVKKNQYEIRKVKKIVIIEGREVKLEWTITILSRLKRIHERHYKSKSQEEKWCSQEQSKDNERGNKESSDVSKKDS